MGIIFQEIIVFSISEGRQNEVIFSPKYANPNMQQVEIR